MRALSILIAVLSTVTTGCASRNGDGDGALPVCDGKHLRPANLHGSVLDATAAATPPASPSQPTAAANYPGCDQ